MSAPVSMVVGAWTQLADVGFKRALVRPLSRKGVYVELAASTPSSASTKLGMYVPPRETFDVHTGNATLALWGRMEDDGTDPILVMLPGDPAQIQTDTVATGHVVQTAEVTYTETGAGTYTGSVTLPAGSTLIDVIINGVALWGAASSAAMIVGDATDPNGIYDAVNLKATDLLAGESISFAQAGGKAGDYIANSQVSPRYSAAERVISGVITSVGAGTAGRTRMTVVWSKPPTALITAAVKT